MRITAPDADMELDGQVALVTGGGSGIGAATAVALARAGARIIVADINPDTAEAVARRIGDSSAAISFTLDVRDPERSAACADLALERFGRLDVLFHAAGVQFQRTTVMETSDQEWSHFIDTNLTGTFYVCRAALPAIARNGSGAIVLMASGRVFNGGLGGAAYAASKGGVFSFAKTLAWEAGKYGVAVNCIIPGITDTDGTRRFQRDVLGIDPKDAVASFASGDPLGRVSTPEEVAGFVRYLAGAGRWITGQAHQLRVYTT